MGAFNRISSLNHSQVSCLLCNPIMRVNYVLALALVAIVADSAMGGRVKRWGLGPPDVSQEVIDQWAAFMLDNIHCEATTQACTVACVASASYYLSPAFSPFASYFCPKVCDRGLELAENQAKNPSDDFVANAAASMQEGVERRSPRPQIPRKPVSPSALLLPSDILVCTAPAALRNSARMKFAQECWQTLL